MTISSSNRQTPPRWGITTLVKDTPEILADFLAYHLDLGAAEIHIFLDDDNPENLAAFGDTDRVFIHQTRDGFWKNYKGYRPKKQEVRQAYSADWVYQNTSTLDWLFHIDVDEFLCASKPIESLLSSVSVEQNIVQIMPAEPLVNEGADGLDPDVTFAKKLYPHDPKTSETFAKFYPNFWRYLRSGFLSHVQGKYAIRTGVKDVELNLHYVLRGDTPLPSDSILDEIELFHFHTPSRAAWHAARPNRMITGSYRVEFPPALPEAQMGLTLYHLFMALEEEEGIEGLDRFFDEVCLARPSLIKALQQQDLMSQFRLDREAKRKKYFPNI